jgi:hypothetical protein
MAHKENRTSQKVSKHAALLMKKRKKVKKRKRDTAKSRIREKKRIKPQRKDLAERSFLSKKSQKGWRLTNYPHSIKKGAQQQCVN